MSFLSQLFAGLKTAIPKKKNKNKGKYEEEYEEEELDEQDKELYQLNRELTLSRKKESSMNNLPPSDVQQDSSDFVDIPDDNLRYDVEPLDLGLNEPDNDHNLNSIYDEPLDKDDLDINVQNASAKPAFSVLADDTDLDNSSTVYTREMKADNHMDYDAEDEEGYDEETKKKGNVFSSIVGKFSKKDDTDNSSVPSLKPSKVEAKNKPKSQKAVAVDIRQLGLLFVLLIMFFGFGYMIFGGQNSEDEVAENPVPTEEKQEEEIASSAIINEKDSIFVNPFIDSAKLAEFAKKTNPNLAQNGNNTTNSSTVQATSSGALPAIPGNYPKPNMPAFNPPALPSSDGSSGMNGAGGPVKVTGVMTGSDGSGIAILSDGSVVSAGESYKDGRIAFIGGDGIHFEDGKVMEYKD